MKRFFCTLFHHNAKGGKVGSSWGSGTGRAKFYCARCLTMVSVNLEAPEGSARALLSIASAFFVGALISFFFLGEPFWGWGGIAFSLGVVFLHNWMLNNGVVR
jgi:hypothetical protein